MNDRPSQTPQVVARGRIRVDARRAIAKLRDHLLVDLHLYGCEIARVAVATGATWLDITWDTDDVVFTFDGRPLPVPDVVRARDHVLAPDPDAQNGAALRVLGIGVSAALGLGPRFVDVIVADASATTRVRFESKHIDEAADAEAPETHVVEAPAALRGAPGLQVHVRKKIGFDAVARAFWRELPREVALVVEATRLTSLAITLHGKTPVRSAEPAVLVRVDLDEPSLRRGSLELLSASPAGARTQFLDLGVRIVDAPALGMSERSDFPVRVVVDSARLPTNASRSAVQLESDVVKRVALRMRSTLEVALQELVNVVTSGDVPAAPLTGGALGGHTVTFLEQRLPVLQELLGSLAASAALARREGNVVLTNAEHALLDLPLLQDALGSPLSLARVRGGTPDHPLFAYSGKEPLPSELAPWLAGVLWKRGNAAERALSALVIHPAEPILLPTAREACARRARALAHEAFPARLPNGGNYLVRRWFDVKEGPMAGLVGEVAVPRHPKPTTARLLVEDRLLEAMPLSGTALPVEMVLSWPGHIIARFTYDAVERNESLNRALLVALHGAALGLLEEHAKNEEPAIDADLARRAVASLVAAAQGLLAQPIEPPGLKEAAIWPLTDGRLATLGELAAYAKETGALCTGYSGAGAAADGRPVLEKDCAREVAALLVPRPALIDISYSFAYDDEALRRALGAHSRSTWLTVSFERKNVVGFLGVGGPTSEERLLFAGRVLRRFTPTCHFGPVLIVYEDRTAVPGTGLEQLLHTRLPVLELRDDEEKLLDRVVDRVLANDPVPLDVMAYLYRSFERVSAVPTMYARRDLLGKAIAKLGGDRQKSASETLERLERLERLEQRAPSEPPPAPRLVYTESLPPAMPPPPPPVAPSPPLGLTGKLAQSLRAVDVTSRHVASVQEVVSGRPVRYDASSKIVFLNTKHTSVKALEKDPQQLLFLGIAAISEINRELAAVTDADEQRILAELLRNG